MGFSFNTGLENASSIPGINPNGNPDYGSNSSIEYDKTLALANQGTDKGNGLFSFPIDLKRMNFKTAEIRDFMEIEILEVIGQGFESAYDKIDVSANDIISADILSQNTAVPSTLQDFLGNDPSKNDFKTYISSSPFSEVFKDTTKLRDRQTKRVAKLWMYEPDQINSDYSLKYADEDLGPTKKIAETISDAVSGKSIPSGIIKQAGTSLISDLVKNVTNFGGSLSVGRLFGGEIDLQKYINFKSRSIPSPLLEYSFEGIQRRKFTFSWKMYAKSKDEVMESFHIIRLLKKNAYPTRLGNEYYIKYPNIFKIRHLFLNNQDQISENLFLNRIKPCALERISVNYTDSNGFLVFDKQLNIENIDSSGNVAKLQNAIGKAPIGIEITLEFTELELLLGDDFDLDPTQTNPYQGGGY